MEGSRPSASGMNANENWADRRGSGFAPVSEVGVLRVRGEAVISESSLTSDSSVVTETWTSCWGCGDVEVSSGVGL